MASSSPSLTLLDRFRGCLLGSAVGDCIGTTLEFTARSDREKDWVNDMVGGGKFSLWPGQWTDDTSMALCLAHSLISKGFDAKDQMELYSQWYMKGLFSSTGECFDIGIRTRTSLNQFLEHPEKSLKGIDDEENCKDVDTRVGNGGLMRLASIPMYYFSDPMKCLKMAPVSSMTSHPSILSRDSCRFYSALVIGALQGHTRDEILDKDFVPDGVPKNYFTEIRPLCKEVSEIRAGSYKNKKRSEISSSGFVIHSLEAALWAFYNANDFSTGVLLASNLADDSDTVACIFGQLSGACYGASSIPLKWIDKIFLKSLFETIAEELLRISQTQTNTTLSQEYSDFLSAYFWLWTNYQPILRCALPGPRRFPDPEKYNEAVEKFKASFETEKFGSLSSEKQKQLWNEFYSISHEVRRKYFRVGY